MVRWVGKKDPGRHGGAMFDPTLTLDKVVTPSLTTLRVAESYY